MKKLVLAAMLVLLPVLLVGCTTAGAASPLDRNNPVTITVWHHHTGAVLNAFDQMVFEFNETVGIEEGIIVEAISFGNMGELEAAVRASANNEAGSRELPNIFASFPDTAYLTQELGLLADLDEYFTPEQQAEYFAPFIERGRMGMEGELRIFPISKSTEIMLVNETSWAPFAQQFGFTFDNLATMEGIAYVAQIYYHYYSGGRAFWGRDSMANFFVISSKKFGTEIFEVNNGQATINVNEEAMRRIWDYYYTPFVSGYFAAQARFRSDDVRVGDLLAYVGSTVSAAFFPQYIRIDGVNTPIRAHAMAPPLFAGVDRVMVQQGAGMVVTTATPEERYASLRFLRWFTEPAQNLRFSSITGYLPVRDAAMSADLVRDASYEAGNPLSDVVYDTLVVSIDTLRNSQIYATSAFTGAVDARNILTRSLQNKAEADRAAILQLIYDGTPREEAIAQFANPERFNQWLTEFTAELNAAVGN